ncbi:MAG: hypothetical protein AAF567_23415 [Actinomycetota bacterium]
MSATTDATIPADDPRVGARNARAEAIERSGDRGARVFEPSPPAVTEDPFADDPVAAEGDPTVDWSAWLAVNPQGADWAAERMLAGDRSLGAIPATLTATRLALHRLATYVIAPARHASNGKFGLRHTLGGFGTPFFGDDRQIRVVGDRLVDQVGDRARSTPITSLRAAAEFLGVEIDAATAAEHDSPEVGDVDEDLAVDVEASLFLGRWFAMGFAALEAVRADAASHDPSRPQLWPGHFDPAIEVGDEDHRGSYGASPGDHAIDEPYLYVSVWWPDRIGLDTDDPRWNAPSYPGAMLRLSEFGDGDPVEIATRFWSETRNALG